MELNYDINGLLNDDNGTDETEEEDESETDDVENDDDTKMKKDGN